MIRKFEKIKYVYDLCRRRAQEGHLSTARQIAEILWLQLTSGIGYSLYHYAGMWDRDASWDYKTSFLSQKKYVKKIDEINIHKYHGITQSKPVEKAFFQLFNIPTGEYLGVLNREWGICHTGTPLQGKEDFKQLISNNIDEKICFKLLEGAGGKGFKAYHIINKNNEIMACHIMDKQEYHLDTLFDILMAEDQRGWLLEKYITQHAVMNALNPASVNTIRMYVFQDKSGVITVLDSFLRIGRQSSLVDNSAGGGLVSKITMDSGILQPACEFYKLDSPALSRHPDHNSKIEGILIPFWQEAMSLAKKTLLALPGTRFAGMDIAITPEGPVMVEVNIQPDIEGLISMKIPTAKIFNT